MKDYSSYFYSYTREDDETYPKVITEEHIKEMIADPYKAGVYIYWESSLQGWDFWWEFSSESPKEGLAFLISLLHTNLVEEMF